MRLSIPILVFLLSLNSAWAQKPDSTLAAPTNAFEHLLQERYKPQRRDFHGRRWKENSSVSAFGGMTHLLLGKPAARNSAEFGLSYSRAWSPLHTLRVSASYGETFNEDFSYAKHRRMGLEFDDMHSILDNFWGYRPDRYFDLQTVLGFGVYMSEPKKGKSLFSVGAHAGLHLSYALYRHLNIFVEPRVHLYTDGYDGFKGDNRTRGYHTGVQFWAGTTYQFRPREIARFPWEDFYLEYSLGVEGDILKMNDKRNGKRLGGLGASFGLALGRWYLPLGYRVTLFAGHHSVPNVQMDDKRLHFLTGIHWEGMLNLNNLFNREAVHPRFEVNLGGGYDTGILTQNRDAYYTKSVLFAHGPTASGQALYRISGSKAIFAQGRFGRLTAQQAHQDGHSSTLRKKLFSVELGMQYSRDRKLVHKSNLLFKPKNYITVTGGMNATLHGWNANSTGSFLKSDLKGVDYALGIARKYSPYSTIRAGLEMGTYGVNKGEKLHPFTLTAGYMVDLTTLLTRYRADRLFTLSIPIDLLYSHHERGVSEENGTRNDGHYWGVEIGLNEHFRLNERWGLFVAQGFRMYKGRYSPSSVAYGSLKLSHIIRLNMGMTYAF